MNGPVPTGSRQRQLDALRRDRASRDLRSEIAEERRVLGVFELELLRCTDRRSVTGVDIGVERAKTAGLAPGSMMRSKVSFTSSAEKPLPLWKVTPLAQREDVGDVVRLLVARRQVGLDLYVRRPAQQAAVDQRREVLGTRTRSG